MELTLINFIFTAVSKPYEENNTAEIMNEIAILLCVYIMHVFFLSNDAEFSAIIGWVFIGVCAQNIVINFGWIFIKTFITMFEDFKKWLFNKVDE